jgi:hypothetical protein
MLPRSIAERWTVIADESYRGLVFGETVLWQGQPYPDLMFRPIVLMLAAAILIATGALIGFAVPAVLAGRIGPMEPGLLPAIGTPFVGMCSVLCWWLYQRSARRNVCYTLTNTRLIIGKRHSLYHARSIDLADLADPATDAPAGGTGTIRFNQNRSHPQPAIVRLWSRFANPAPALLHVANARSVLELLRIQIGRQPA